MPQPARSRQAPWIESLILSYDHQEAGSSSSRRRLRAHVVGVGQMSQSQSQAQGSESPTGLLFLSDGVFQIPAILTTSAWEHLQEQGDCESFSSLVNTTVCIQDYRLQFYMAQEQTKCRFFLSIGGLAMTAAGPVKDNTPCCTTLPSVRLKICKTWRILLGQEARDSQASQCGFDLSELLGEWQHDCMQAVLEDVRERLVMASSCPVSQQPSTSTYALSLNHPETATATSWDADRVRYKGVKCFSVPVKYVLIQENAQQLQTQPNVESRTPCGSEDTKQDLPQVCSPSNTTPSIDDVEWRITKPQVIQTDCNADKSSLLPEEDSMLHECLITGMIDSSIRPLYNPWDIFPPPSEISSSSDASLEATPTHSLHNPTASESTPDHAAVLTSTQLPVHSSKESVPTSEQSKEEHSSLPLYQKPPHSSSCPTASSSTSTSASPLEPFTSTSNLLPTTDKPHSTTAQPNPLALDQEGHILEKDIEETVERKYKKAKRKRREPTPEAPTTSLDEEEEEAQISRSPPSWLFETQTGIMAKEDESNQHVQTAGTVSRKPVTVHSDGKLFSYSYQVSGQNLQDFSQFKVPESLLHWAVKYLVVQKQMDNPPITSVTSDQTLS